MVVIIDLTGEAPKQLKASKVKKQQATVVFLDAPVGKAKSPTVGKYFKERRAPLVRFGPKKRPMKPIEASYISWKKVK